MQVISGNAKGHKLSTLKGSDTRPTAARVKESIFNIIANNIKDANILDLFAGSGALGIEALSRGARHVDFVDNNRMACEIIKQNLKYTQLYQLGKVYNSTWNNYINKSWNSSTKYDIIFVDPPYEEKYIKPVLNIIYTKDLLSENGIIIIESDIKYDIITELKTYKQFDIIKSKKYGRTNISVLTC